jgi:hypothetical protein
VGHLAGRSGDTARQKEADEETEADGGDREADRDGARGVVRRLRGRLDVAGDLVLLVEEGIDGLVDLLRQADALGVVGVQRTRPISGVESAEERLVAPGSIGVPGTLQSGQGLHVLAVGVGFVHLLHQHLELGINGGDLLPQEVALGWVLRQQVAQQIRPGLPGVVGVVRQQIGPTEHVDVHRALLFVEAFHGEQGVEPQRAGEQGHDDEAGEQLGANPQSHSYPPVVAAG